MKCLSGNFNKNYIQFISNRENTHTHTSILRASMESNAYIYVCMCVYYIDDDPLGEMLIAYSECQSSTFNSAED